MSRETGLIFYLSRLYGNRILPGMAHDVFVCHSGKDKPTADAVCAVLESQGIRCWVPSRDISPGMAWGESVVEAIRNARVMVLIVSAHANDSSEVKREVACAAQHGIPIIPLRIEAVKPDAALECFLKPESWVDAIEPPLAEHLFHLARRVGEFIGRPAQEAVMCAPTAKPKTLPAPAAKPAFVVGSEARSHDPFLAGADAPLPPPNISQTVQIELKKLEPGLIVFRVSETMKLGKTETVEARIAKKTKASIEAVLHGFNNLSIEEIKVGSFMKMRLQGDSFEIKPLNSEEQIVPDEGFAAWKWRATPLEPGNQLLSLLVTVSIKFTGVETNHDLPILEKQIAVAVNRAYSAKQFWSKNWQWIIGTLGGSGLLLWILEKFFVHSKP